MRLNMNFRLFYACLLIFTSCNRTDNNVCLIDNPSSYNYSITQDTFSVHSETIQFLQSYYLTAPYPAAGTHGVLAYNAKKHSIDIFNQNTPITSLQLEQHGKEGVVNRLSAINATSKDSIWLFDNVAFYLMDSSGKVLNKYRTNSIPLCECNYAINSATFGFNKNGELIYPIKTSQNQFELEFFDTRRGIVSAHIPIPFPTNNITGKKNFGYMDAPNVSFFGDTIICNFPYSSEFVIINMSENNITQYKADSHYGIADIIPYEGGEKAIEMQKYGWKNPHYYQFLYLPNLEMFVRPMLGGTDTKKHANINDMVDCQTLYLMFFDKNLKIIGEYPMEAATFNNFNGWVGLEDGVLLFRDNVLSNELSPNLSCSVISLCKK